MKLFLEHKKYIVTGSSRGIGLGIAKTLLEEGASVMITGIDSAEVMDTFTQLNNEFSEKVMFQDGNLTDPIVITLLENKIIKEWGNIDGIIANAGAVKPVPDWDILTLDWDWYFQNNFEIAVGLVTMTIPYLIKTKGNIVFIGSIAGIEEIGAPLPYSTSKAALTMYSKGLSRKLAQYKIRVNTVAPGNIIFKDGNWDKKSKTDLASVNKMLEEKVPLKQFGTPEDIGNIVAFLLSEKAKFITGACIVIDGGQTSMCA